MKRCASIVVGSILLSFASLAPAQAWPSKPIKYIVPFAPGGTTDILGRTIGEKLSVALGQPVIIENKPGAGGGVGAEATAKAAPDGYTIMGGTISTHAINASLYSNLPYDPVRDFVPITLIARVPNMLVINPAIPAKDVKELIALMKARPGTFTFASSGNGTSQHLSGELFKSMAGVEMQHIPYKGSPPALQDVVGGQVSMTFDNITTAWPLTKGGKLRALA
ncbi:MAG: tripartite tricarboxylate transporter substrate-binding protein, partial [Betaproteobacteria bacterium]